MRDFIKEWLDALRSGKFAQAKTRLRTDDNHFCCVGVGCETLDPNGWEKSLYSGYFYKDDRHMAPEELLKATGFSSNFCQSLYGLNDDLGFSFEQIADYIEGKTNNGTALRKLTD